MTHTFNNQKVAVLGFGREGKASAAYISSHGGQVVIFDEKPLAAFEPPDQELLAHLPNVLGPGAFSDLQGITLAFRSPGIPMRSEVIASLKQSGVTITSQTKWFFEHATAPIIGVTGTKGKGTTCSLIFSLLGTWGKRRIFLTGNIGKTAPFEILDTLGTGDLVVFELSSFQLQDLTQSPFIAVVLMVTEEHLDHHASVTEYREAKESIVKFQGEGDFAIINADFEASVNIGQNGLGHKWYFSRVREVRVGAFIKDQEIIVRTLREYAIQIKNIQLRGSHNLENILAAVLVGVALGVPNEILEQSIQSFKGLEHRLEFVTEKRGVKFYNDSFSTTPESTIAAIQSFSEPIILILGGSEKNSNFDELATVITKQGNIKEVVLVGETAERLNSALVLAHFTGKVTKLFKTTIEQIFSMSTSSAKPGDVVLLSPACASFGLFRNYEERGLKFKQQVTVW